MVLRAIRTRPACCTGTPRRCARSGRSARWRSGLLNGAPVRRRVAGADRCGRGACRAVLHGGGLFHAGGRSRAPWRSDPRVRLCPPVGTHDGMAGLIERQALAACEAMGVPSRTAAVLVVGHGSASAPGRTLALHEHAARVGWTTPVRPGRIRLPGGTAVRRRGAARIAPSSRRGYRLLRRRGRPCARRRAGPGRGGAGGAGTRRPGGALHRLRHGRSGDGADHPGPGGGI